MKDLRNFITESMIVEANKGSIRDYVLWHYELDDIKDFSYDKFVSKSFDDKALAKYYDGNLQTMYNELLGLMQSEKKASIDISWKGDNRINKIKVAGKTFNTTSTKRWYAERINKYTGNDNTKLTYQGQLDFTSYLRDRLLKENWLDKLGISTRDAVYRMGGIVYFDHVNGVFAGNDHNITGLKADGTLTYDEAYKIALNYLKNECK